MGATRLASVKRCSFYLVESVFLPLHYHARRVAPIRASVFNRERCSYYVSSRADIVQTLCKRVYTSKASEYQVFYIEKCRVQTFPNFVNASPNQMTQLVVFQYASCDGAEK